MPAFVCSHKQPLLQWANCLSSTAVSNVAVAWLDNARWPLLQFQWPSRNPSVPTVDTSICCMGEHDGGVWIDGPHDHRWQTDTQVKTRLMSLTCGCLNRTPTLFYFWCICVYPGAVLTSSLHYLVVVAMWIYSNSGSGCYIRIDTCIIAFHGITVTVTFCHLWT